MSRVEPFCTGNYTGADFVGSDFGEPRSYDQPWWSLTCPAAVLAERTVAAFVGPLALLVPMFVPRQPRSAYTPPLHRPSNGNNPPVDVVLTPVGKVRARADSAPTAPDSRCHSYSWQHRYRDTYTTQGGT